MLSFFFPLFAFLSCQHPSAAPKKGKIELEATENKVDKFTLHSAHVCMFTHHTLSQFSCTISREIKTKRYFSH